MTLSDPMTPEPFRLVQRRKDLADTFTIELVPMNGGSAAFQPGQFNMLYHFGVGEVPISISGDPKDSKKMVHTIRNVGAVTDAMSKLVKGDMVGVRGPYGSAWPVTDVEGADMVIIAGGVGLAPLRPAVYHVLANRKKYGRFVILYGARTPADILFLKELEKWSAHLDVYVGATVDHASGDWAGNVGTVTKLIPRANFDSENVAVFVCGPEIMMRFTISTLEERGVDKNSIYVSLERNMKCAVGFCGHCQFGGHFICKDGPVFPYGKIEDLFKIREL